MQQCVSMNPVVKCLLDARHHSDDNTRFSGTTIQFHPAHVPHKLHAGGLPIAAVSWPVMRKQGEAENVSAEKSARMYLA